MSSCLCKAPSRLNQEIEVKTPERSLADETPHLLHIYHVPSACIPRSRLLRTPISFSRSTQDTVSFPADVRDAIGTPFTSATRGRQLRA